MKTMNDRHTCTRPERNRQATYKWIASHFIENFRMNLDWPISDMLREINEQFAITVSRNVCYKARSLARRMLEGSLNEHYHLLPTYVAKLRSAYLTGRFCASLKHKYDGQTKFIKPNSQRQDRIIKYWVSIGSIHREQG